MFYSTVLTFLAILVYNIQCRTVFTSPAQNQNSEFGAWGENPNYDIGQPVTLNWESNYIRFDLYLLLTYPQESSFQLAENTISKEFLWTASLENTTRRVPDGGTYVFWFTVHAYNNSHSCSSYEDTESIFFNITKPETGFTTREIAGITAGSVVGGLLVIAAIGFYIRRSLQDFKGYLAWKKSQRESAGCMQTQQMSPALSNPMYYDERMQYSLAPPDSTVVMKSELPSTNDVTNPRELDITPAR